MRSGVILSAYVVRIYVSLCIYICVRVLTDGRNGTDGRTGGQACVCGEGERRKRNAMKGMWGCVRARVHVHVSDEAQSQMHERTEEVPMSEYTRMNEQ